ncbi:hypothetical protein R3P38DRAFT_2791506 [Favolaschia claudopus]|uniref:Uncharacterized protein n=1 Tax=Favolaschia claudopus TaxID=2862362 RepID=A0AAW0AHC9_9AGAR
MAKRGQKRKRVRKPKEERRNLRLWAEGVRESILAPHLDAYQVAMDQGRRQERKFLKKPAEEEQLSEEEEKARAERLNELNPRIRRWFTYRLRKQRKRLRTSKDEDPRKDPYAVLLANLSGVTSPPKALQAYQQFMRESYEEKAIGDRAKAEAAEAKAAYLGTLKAPPSQSPAARQRCIDSVADFAGPILQGLYTHTGLHATLIMGGPVPEFGGEIRTLHVSYGRNRTVQAAHWPQWDKARFATVTQSMIDYLHTAYNSSDSDEDSDEDSDDEDASDDEHPPTKKRKVRNTRDIPTTTKRRTKAPTVPAEVATTSQNSYEAERQDNIRRNQELLAQIKSGVYDNLDTEIGKEVADLMAQLRQYVKPTPTAEQSSAPPPPASSASQPPASSASQPPPSSASHPPPSSASQLPPSSAPQPPAAQPPPSSASQPPPSSAPQPPLAPPSSSVPKPRRKSKRIAQTSHAEPMDVDTAIPPAQSAATESGPPLDLAHNDRLQLGDGGDSSARGAANDSSGTESATHQPPSTLPPMSQAAQAAIASAPTLQNSSGSPILTPCPSNAAKWFTDAHAAMTRVNLGCHFSALVAAWTRVEVASRFQHSPSNLSAKLRPKQVSAWISNGRRTESVVDNPARFAKEWQAWWDSLQPSWRVRETSGEWSITRGYGANGREWGPLYHWGVNGVLTIVASLFFWGRAVESDAELRILWETAVLDVVWMLEGMACYYELFKGKF